MTVLSTRIRRAFQITDPDDDRLPNDITTLKSSPGQYIHVMHGWFLYDAADCFFSQRLEPCLYLCFLLPSVNHPIYLFLISVMISATLT